MNEIVRFGATGLVPVNMDEALRLAEFMAKARTVPRHLQDSPGDCLMVIEQSMRWGMSPFAVAQATSVIAGKLMWEGKLVAAAIENSGAIVGHIDYAFEGDGDTRAVIVSATRKGETNPRTVRVELKNARTANEMWKRQPDQQLVYHGARVWARRWTPAVILGVYSREEMGQIIDGEIASDDAEVPAVVVQKPAHTGSMREVAQQLQQGQQPLSGTVSAPYIHAPRDDRDAMNAAVPIEDAQPKRQTFTSWFADLERDLAQAQSTAGVEAIQAREKVTAVMLASGGGKVQAERAAVVQAAIDAAHERVFQTPQPVAASEDGWPLAAEAEA